MADLTTQAKVKSVLGIPTAVTEHDGLIDILIDVVDTEVLGYVGMSTLTQQTITEYHDILDNTENQIRLQNFPASSITSIENDGTALTSSQYYLDEDVGYVRMKTVGSYFATGYQKVKVVYVAGYSSVPSDLSYAATVLAAAHFNSGRHAGMLYEQVATYRYRRREGMPEEAIRILAKYLRVFARP
jgi:hypothetical protein